MTSFWSSIFGNIDQQEQTDKIQGSTTSVLELKSISVILGFSGKLNIILNKKSLKKSVQFSHNMVYL